MGVCAKGRMKGRMAKYQESKYDVRGMPAYTLAEAAHYLDVPQPTIRYWSLGRGNRRPLIHIAARRGKTALLSFFNLTELHVLAAIRRKHKIRMLRIRKALQWLERHSSSNMGKKHPLAWHDLETDSLDLFVRHYGKLINISRAGQVEIKTFMDAALKRIERDDFGIPVRFFPFTQSSIENAPASILIDPHISSGRPAIKGVGVATQAIAARHKAGESIRALGEDYGCEEGQIEEAIRCELRKAA